MKAKPPDGEAYSFFACGGDNSARGSVAPAWRGGDRRAHRRGILLGLTLFLRALLTRKTADFNAIRLTLSRYLALALEFQLGADILSTAVAPTWTEIGKLGTIAVIRTGLNYFLSREMQEEQGARGAQENAVQKEAGG